MSVALNLQVWHLLLRNIDEIVMAEYIVYYVVGSNLLT